MSAHHTSLPPLTAPGWENIPNVAHAAACSEEDSCGICREPYTDPHRTACGHTFCKECVLAWYQLRLTPTDIDGEVHDLAVTCPACRENLYMADVPGTGHALHFLHIPMLLRRSGLLDGTFTGGAGLPIHPVRLAPAWHRDVNDGVDFLLRGMPDITDAPVKMLPLQAARDVVILGNLMKVYIQHHAMSCSQTEAFGQKMDYVIGKLANRLLQDWPLIQTTTDELTELLRQELVGECHKDKQCPLGHDDGHGLFVQRLIGYVCTRAVHRGLTEWIAEACGAKITATIS